MKSFVERSLGRHTIVVGLLAVASLVSLTAIARPRGTVRNSVRGAAIGAGVGALIDGGNGARTGAAAGAVAGAVARR